MEFSVSWLLSNIHVTGFSGENFGLLELDMIFSAEATLSQCHLSGCPNHMGQSGYFPLVSIAQPLCPMYTWPHSHSLQSQV